MRASAAKREGEKSRGTAVKKVFLVEDHPVFRLGLANIISRGGSLEVCGQAGDAESALEAIRQSMPDLVIVDLGLPGKSGLDLIKEIRGFSQDIKLLVVSMHDEAVYADRVMRAGGNGYIMKEKDPEEILSAVRDVLAGHLYISEEVLASNPG